MEISPTPKRRTLPALTEEWLKEAIVKQRWSGHLPSERQLAAELRIGRATLRTALARLEQTGWIVRQARSQTLIVPRKRTLPDASSRMLVLLSPGSLPSHRVAAMSGPLQLFRTILHTSPEPRFRLVEIHDRRLRNPALTVGLLEKALEENPNGVWVLLGTSPEIQRFFEQRKVPAIILGHRFPGVKICAADIDLNAVCWHAATRMVRAGCRQLHLLLVDRRRAGDLAAQEGLDRALKGVAGVSTQTHVIRKAEEIDRLLEPLRMAANRPAGFIAVSPHIAVSLVCSALGRRLALQREVLITSLYDDPIFQLLPEKVPRYSKTGLYEKVSELIAAALNGEALKPKQHLFVPELIDTPAG
ncbi:MAG TPA: GntR family transcriptional regulator [Chthoniobacteraceae bacterium]|nr:GntR family transcriptional regulator [Chthoniobacteraceae bacterium]